MRTFLKGRVPGQLVIQLTDKCNALCPQCGMRVTSKFPRSTLDLDQIRRTIDAAAERGISVLSFTGGEPLLYLDHLVELLDHAGRAGIEYLRTGTNAYFLARPSAPDFERRVHTVAGKLAGTPIRNFWISIDSAVPAVHEEMRGFRDVVKGIEKAVPIFHEYGLYPSANLGLNRQVGGELTWNLSESDLDQDGYLEEFSRRYREALSSFYMLVIDLGFSIVNCCYPMSVGPAEAEQLDAVYGATASTRIVQFSDQEKAALFQALLETIPRFRSEIRVFSPLTTLYSLVRHYQNGDRASAYGCRGGVDFFFVSAQDGNTYPCGYRGSENLGDFGDLDMRGRGPDATCTECDWECFRDPSELSGPLLEALNSPRRAWRRMREDPRFRSLWIDDLRYYRACELFDGRKPAGKGRLRAWAGSNSEPGGVESALEPPP
jgi:MoaA/NifB/PqqE/SkfB family radical SAM enzyme